MTQFSWRTKLNTLFILILTASLLIQVFYIVPFIQDREVESAELRQKVITHSVEREVDIGLTRLAESLESIAEVTVIRTMDVDNQLDVLFQYVNMSADIMSLFVMNKIWWFVSGTVEDFAVYYTTRSYNYTGNITTDSAQVLTQMIEDLLVASRVDVRKIKLEWEPYQLSNIIQYR